MFLVIYCFGTKLSKQQKFYYQMSGPNYHFQRQLNERMRVGTGVNQLIKADNAPTHHLDALQQFKKDFAAMDREQRSMDISKQQQQIERKRLAMMERQNQRWEKMEGEYNKLKQREYGKAYSQLMGVKKTHNTGGLAYNPVNLSYNQNPEGDKLRHQDEEAELRRFIRVKNIDERGHGKYNLINGQPRKGIDEVVPETLQNRYSSKLYNYYDGLKLKVPSEASSPPRRYA